VAEGAQAALALHLEPVLKWRVGLVDASVRGRVAEEGVLGLAVEFSSRHLDQLGSGEALEFRKLVAFELLDLVDVAALASELVVAGLPVEDLAVPRALLICADRIVDALEVPRALLLDLPLVLAGLAATAEHADVAVFIHRAGIVLGSPLAALPNLLLLAVDHSGEVEALLRLALVVILAFIPR